MMCHANYFTVPCYKDIFCHPKYAKHPNVDAKFQTGTTAINLHGLGFAKTGITV